MPRKYQLTKSQVELLMKHNCSYRFYDLGTINSNGDRVHTLHCQVVDVSRKHHAAGLKDCTAAGGNEQEALNNAIKLLESVPTPQSVEEVMAENARLKAEATKTPVKKKRKTKKKTAPVFPVEPELAEA